MFACWERDVKMWFVAGPLSTTTGGDTKLCHGTNNTCTDTEPAKLVLTLFCMHSYNIIPMMLMLVAMMSECRGAGLHDKQVVSIGIPCHHTQAEYLNCAMWGPECRVPLVPIPGGGVWVYLVWCPSGICTHSSRPVPSSDPTVTPAKTNWPINAVLAVNIAAVSCILPSSSPSR